MQVLCEVVFTDPPYLRLDNHTVFAEVGTKEVHIYQYYNVHTAANLPPLRDKTSSDDSTE